MGPPGGQLGPLGLTSSDMVDTGLAPPSREPPTCCWTPPRPVAAEGQGHKLRDAPWPAAPTACTPSRPPSA